MDEHMHGHDCGCCGDDDCGCGCGCEENGEEIITLFDDDGNQSNYIIVDGVEYNGKVYLALVAEEEADQDECEFLILRADQDGDEELLTTIEDENEFNEVMKLLDAKLEEDDIVVIGSYYALNPVLREKVLELLEQAREKKAIVYYDPNFRSSHKEEAIKLAPTIIENLEYADIVRGSQEDFYYMYNLRDAEKIYRDKIKFYCPNFLCTAGAEKITLRTASIAKEYDIPPLKAVSTIGAGDNFNAGIIYGLLKYDVRYDDLNTISEAKWDRIIRYGMEFAAEVCKSYSNSVSHEFAERISKDGCNS